jgi:hypothetical protein
MWFWCGSKNTYRKDMFVKEIRLHVENMITILDSYSQLNKGDLNDHINEDENVTFVNIIFISAPKVTKKVATTPICIW